MDNFGVVEVASQRRAVAPGWAYVPDNSSRNVPPGYAAAMAAAANNAAANAAEAGGADGAGAGPKNARKRSTRNQGGAAGGAGGSSVALFSHLTSRQETKLRKELELLDRDGGPSVGGGGRDSQIPIPAKAVKAQNKYTPNVRKILASQKSFANHLDDFIALTALHEANPHLYHHLNQNHNNADTSGASTPAKGGSRRAAAKKDTKKDTKRGGSASRRSTSVATPTSVDTPMTDASEAADDKEKAGQEQQSAPVATSSILLPYTGPRPPAGPGDNDPLLMSQMPPLPTDDELRALVQGPPLTYSEARADFSTEDGDGRRYPTRVFCEICGYWGRVKCTKCGTPVCALDCLELHREECVTRYGM